ncbi:MAG: insulinase family protein [Proteobacteria bacterium]|nr:insulinase family protein [Pseudomonadota bacterium]
MKVVEVTSPLGLKAWLVEDRSTPVVSLCFSFDGGSARDPEAHRGLTGITATLLTDGAGSLDAQAFRQRQEETAVSLGFGAALDRVGGSMRTLSARCDEAFDLLRLAVTAPRFDAGRFDHRRRQAIAGLNQAEQRPATVAERCLMATVFAGHPYAITASGVRESLRDLAVDQVKTRARALLVRNGLVVAAVGDIDATELARQLDRTFGGLPEGAALPPLPDWNPPIKARTVCLERPVPQSSMLIALPGLLREDPDWHAALVMARVLGGGQQSRLFNEVREKRGLAYSISADLREQQKSGLLVVSTGSANEHVARSLEVIRAELARMREGATDQELADARTYLSGSLALSLDSSSAIANLVHQMQVERLPRDYLDRRAAVIGAVTAEDVRRVARRVLREEAMTTVVVGKPVGLVSEP